MNIIQPYKELFEEYGYEWRDRQMPLNLNIFGVRSSKRRVNEFDDFLYVVYRNHNKEWRIHQWEITTDPGLTTLHNPLNSKGTAILVPGQYKSAYKLGLHRNRYKALVQEGAPVKVYRDYNQDSSLDLDECTIDEGFFGINIHKAGSDSTQVNDWSAGCQVFKRSSDFNEFIDLCSTSAKIYGNSFTYTLFDI